MERDSFLFVSGKCKFTGIHRKLSSEVMEMGKYCLEASGFSYGSGVLSAPIFFFSFERCKSDKISGCIIPVSSLRWHFYKYLI